MNAFKIGYESVADIADCDLQSVSVDWNVTLLLPPEDVDLGAKPLGDLVRRQSNSSCLALVRLLTSVL